MSMAAPGIDHDVMEALRKVARDRASADSAHDWLHVVRVERNAVHIAEAEGADAAVVRAAALLHELVNLPKDHPDSHRSGELCAEQALAVLRDSGLDDATSLRVAQCIRVHGWSAGLAPPDLESAVLQDADRLDAIGAIGAARCFATSQAMRRPFYAPQDPFCDAREPDDKAYAVDHFYRKLLRIPERLHTAEARRIGAERASFLRAYLEQLRREIG